MRCRIAPFNLGFVDLKLRLALRVVALAALCFVVATVCILVADVYFERTQMAATADLVAQELKLQLDLTARFKLGGARFPDLDVIAAPFASPGQCIAYRGTIDTTSQQFCSGTQPSTAPPVFATIYRFLISRDAEVTRPVTSEGKIQGFAVVSVDVMSLIEQGWHDTSRLLSVMAVTLLVLCGLIYIAVSQILRPTRTIVSGLEALSASQFSTRLPNFDLAELSAIRGVFNSLAETLERTVAERNALTQRLIAVQDEERLSLSRDLHDEFGQSLTAINAMAASAAQTAKDECPLILPECESISRTAAQMMETLRGTLVRLRPPDIVELGLTTSLQSLLADWNTRMRGKTTFEAECLGDLDELPLPVGVSIYRIVQEAVTNAARHANAKRVIVRVELCEPSMSDAESGEGTIELNVEDDGIGIARSKTSGIGLVGMRERVTALGGHMTIETQPTRGTRLHAILPSLAAKLEVPA